MPWNPVRRDNLNVNDIWATAVNWDFLIKPSFGCLLALAKGIAHLVKFVVFTKPVEVLGLFLNFLSSQNIYNIHHTAKYFPGRT